MTTNVYYGDGGVSAVTGNWNTAANWYSNIGVLCNCGVTPGTPLGRVPNISTDQVYLTSAAGGGSLNITTGPTGGWSGLIKTISSNNLPYGNYATNANVSNGTYTGGFTLSGNGALNLSGGTYSAGNMTNSSATVNSFTISGSVSISGTLTGTFTISSTGTFSGANSFANNTFLTGNATYSANQTFGSGTATVSNGTFGSGGSPINIYTNSASALVNITGGSFGTDVFFDSVAGGKFAVSGGTWTPHASVTVNLSTGVLVYTNLPKDPGFALGGTYAPVITVTNLPGILGAGLL